ncbi:MAG: hypothetical protein ACRCR6_03630 [Plesiomonas sp.]
MKKVVLTAVAAVFGLSSMMAVAATTPASAPATAEHHSASVKHHSKTVAHKKMHHATVKKTAEKK